MSKVARLYHEQGLNQSQIAAQLYLSQSTVSRLLKRAQKEQIIRIVIQTPPGTFPELEAKLLERYRLKDVIVVDCAHPDSPAREIGAAAAYYVETTLNQHEIIGISSWSSTLLTMVDAMHPLTRETDAQVIQVLGGMGNPDAEAHAVRLTGRLATLVNGRSRFLPAPGVVGSAESVRVLQDDQFTREVLALFDQVTLALVGIGAVEPSDLLARSGNVFSAQELAMLKEVGAVGDLCLRFFDEDGKPVITSLNDRVIGISLAQLRKAPRAVGIAGGSDKVAAIRGALRGGWINVLITDRFTAEKLL
ncbi:MAG: sugar-binding transcriptional regulator [Caldilineaceae bacterium]